jgi:uncharacterized protein YjbJ (UPF0337 family)
MNTSMLMGSWNEIKGKIKTQWAKLNDDDLEELKGNLDQLAGKIQKVYGYGKEQAEIEFNEFKKSITTSVSAATTTVMEKVDQLMDGDKNKKPEETKTKTTLSFVGAILLTGMMSACSHGPVVQEFADTANPTVEVGNLNSDINTAITNQVDVLSPKNFNEVNSSLQSAKKNLEKNKDAKKTLHEVAEGRAYLTIANQFSKTARANIEEVVLARQSAMDAGAVGYFGNEMKKNRP